MLKGKKIVLGVTGSIAAYKAASLVRLLVKEGAEVKVVMTAAAKDFITPLTLSVLSKNPVLSEFTDGANGEWNNHVELGLWADLLVIAPASADTIAKMANGICDNLLLATYLSARCPVYVAPAMDLDMLKHKATVDNLKRIVSFGNTIIDPANGELASGLTGEGRMEEPERIVEVLKGALADQPLRKKKVLITAGPTHENIDAVRFIGNRSSGKMGFAIAEAFAQGGAEVTLITGPTALVTNNPGIKRINVESADDMYAACMKHFEGADITVMSAAVGDYKPEHVANGKIKKSADDLTIKLVRTKDILAELGGRKTKKQLLVGFALETDNELEYAKDKLAKKNLDLIVLNSLKDEGAGFSHDTNKITIIGKQNNIKEFALKAKADVANDVVKEVVRLLD